MSFSMIMQTENMVKNQTFVTWIQVVSLFTKEQMAFLKTSQKMLKQYFWYFKLWIRQTITIKKKKAIGLMKDGLGRKIMTDFVGLKTKIYSSLIDDNSADEKSKGTKKCVIKRKLRFEHYENCLDATQLENEIKHLEKKKQNWRR